METPKQEVKVSVAGAAKDAQKPAADKPTAEKKDRERSSKNFNKDAKISLLIDKNPKREGSKSHVRFAAYKDGMSVGDFVKAGGTFGDLAWDSARGYIRIEGHTPKLVVRKEKAAKPETAKSEAGQVKGQDVKTQAPGEQKAAPTAQKPAQAPAK